MDELDRLHERVQELEIERDGARQDAAEALDRAEEAERAAEALRKEVLRLDPPQPWDDIDDRGEIEFPDLQHADQIRVDRERTGAKL